MSGMNAKNKKIVFLVACSGLFLLACVATTQFMIRLILWYLDNCGSPSAQCTRVEWLISYWWAIFVPLTLIVALLAHKAYIKLIDRNSSFLT